MASRVNLDKSELVEVEGAGMILSLSLEENGRVVVRVESESGGKRIKIKQHESESGAIVYYSEDPSQGHGLRLV